MNLTNLLSNQLPTIIIATLAYYFFKKFVANENNRRIISLKKEIKKTTLPMVFQAYERITIFIERINPSSLLLRVTPIGDDKHDYASLLTKSIEQEYEHNLSQQIYIDEECWNVISTSKNSTIRLIDETCKTETIKNAKELREAILKKTLNGTPPSAIALSLIKKEVQKLL